jgi:hypothetical protein
MDIDRRSLLAGAAGLALTGLLGLPDVKLAAGEDTSPGAPSWHPFTRSLLRRAWRASSADGRTNTAMLSSSGHAYGPKPARRKPARVQF